MVATDREEVVYNVIVGIAVGAGKSTFGCCVVRLNWHLDVHFFLDDFLDGFN